ncbi:hypothetical protein SteCoe_32522 [Stentor coeruleus]|uniref:DNA/RNA-binding protein Alba-like domain-containing protein n=1 Tax=Stentor coeruleus TaxID=5963 RepID=A0A1R2AYT9_9CILI|nr:hypothetical protein SteCoe_32522 [Stentor coeruleus]
MAIEIRAGAEKPYPIFVNEAKQGLKDKGNIELHGLGDSIKNVIIAGGRLTSWGYAELVSFHTLALNQDCDDQTRIIPKVIISLKKASTFDKVFQDFENRRSGK